MHSIHKKEFSIVLQSAISLEVHFFSKRKLDDMLVLLKDSYFGTHVANSLRFTFGSQSFDGYLIVFFIILLRLGKLTTFYSDAYDQSIPIKRLRFTASLRIGKRHVKRINHR